MQLHLSATNEHVYVVHTQSVALFVEQCRSHDSHVIGCILRAHCSNNESVVQEVRALEEQAFTLPKFILKKVQELMREIIGGLIYNTECARDDRVSVVTSYLRIVTV